MTALWPIALITFKEGIRNRSFYGISLLALLLFGMSFIISGMIPQDVGKVTVDLALSIVSFSGLLLVLFVGINLLAKDLDKRTIYMVLSRPISRSEYIYGKFLGMVFLILATMFIVGVFSFLSIFLSKIIYQNNFQRVSWSLVLLAIAFTTLMLLLLSAQSFLFASFTSSSFITLVLTISSYIIGQSLSDVKAIVEAPQTVGIKVSSITVTVIQTAYYIFPNLSFFDIKTRVAHGLSVPFSFVFWTFSYGLIYTLIVIVLAALIFRKKEFP
jgi:ABC-type transport system involved in multi-copper enzyme maturation permease subunit